MSAVQTARTELFIGGKWQPSADARRIDVIDPATGQVLTSVADASVADGLAAVDAASAALAGWSARAPRERGEILRAAFALMTDRAEELARLIVRENGKALT